LNATEKYGNNQTLLKLAKSTDEEISMEATEKLLCANMGLVRGIALRFKGGGTEYEDLVQIGTIGMIKAIRTFELDRGTAFSTYAVPLIVGEIRRHLRDDGIIKISRYHRKLGIELRQAEQRIMNEEGREAHIDELAAVCGVDAEEAAMALEATAPVMSFSSSASGDDGAELENCIADERDCEEMEHLVDRIALGQAVNRLQPLWQRIVILRYYRNLTQQETAEKLGLSQVKISREEKKIMEHLRKLLS
jgi:RNA polymerase sporulation-specific sigma factor